MTVITRFAPSPTGYLHIGSARTALFNWLFARHHGGRFLLRVEDTDRARSTEESIKAIYDGMRWLGLDWDGDAISQFARRSRHAEVATQLLDSGRAYLCYASVEELEEMRAKARAEGRQPRYDGRWRDRDPESAPPGIAPVIRLKAPLDGETVINDAVQGQVRVQNTQLDDMVLLRSDGTPTYMLAVVVDDHDMGITHVIRGDDHFTNSFRQAQLYHALGWPLPVFAHVPLIHGMDGRKLGKRHGATAVADYGRMGYLPEAMRNYLLRLGWSHGDDEIIDTEQAIAWFSLGGIGKAAAKFDFQKLGALNAHYLRTMPADLLLERLRPALTEQAGRRLDAIEEQRITYLMPHLTQRAKLIPEVVENTKFLLSDFVPDYDEKALALLDQDGREQLIRILPLLEQCDPFDAETLEGAVRAYVEQQELKLGKVLQPLRAALTGTTTSPPIFEAAAMLGPAICRDRIERAVAIRPS